MRNLLIASAVVELSAGLALLAFPSATAVLLVGSALEAPAALTVARVAGAGLSALGIACWLARCEAQSRAARGLLAALLFYNLAAAAILAYAGLGDGLHGLALWPGVALHTGLGLWCVGSLRQTGVH